MDKLRKQGALKIDSFTGNERTTLENIFVYDIHLRYLDDMDLLIQQHLNEKNKPIKVSFAKQLIKDFEDYGFSTEHAYRYLAVLYQIRKAFYFINTAVVGNCASMKALRCSLWNSVFTFDIRYYKDYLWDRMEDFSTLIIGDTGTGKGTAANAIGQSGLMRYNPETQTFSNTLAESYMLINLSEYPESLIESALFGHTKGSFTGATDKFSGIFQRCIPHGTLFLDEIGEVTQHNQVKLLNVLQDRRFTPVGSDKELRFEGRVISATSKSLADIRQDGKMRDDLFYRLSSDIIVMPTLQQRIQENPDELIQLICVLINRMTGDENTQLAEWVHAHLIKQLPKHYAWPGNVRELEQAIRSILLKRQYTGSDYVNSRQSSEENRLDLPSADIDAKQLLALYCQLLYEKHGTFETVSRIVNLDRRTVKKYIMN